MYKRGGAVALGGCAAITTGTSEPLSVETLASTGEVTGATCKLVNSKGVWFVSSTPGSVTVHSAYGPLDVTCKKAGQKPGLATVDSATKGMISGNLLFGGLIGAAIDAGTGVGYDYPALIQV